MGAPTKLVNNILTAMRLIESGNDYNRKEAGGGPSFGAYQFLPETWDYWSKKYSMETWGVPVKLPMSQENQDAVAGWKVRNLLDEGRTPEQIASIWNSGSPNWQGKRGVNKYGIAYDVPRHVSKFKRAFNYVNQVLGPAEAEAAELIDPFDAPEQTKKPAGTAAPSTLVDPFDEPETGPNRLSIRQGEAPQVAEPASASQDPASFMTLVQAAIVDDPKTKLKIFAQKRFPDMDPEDAAKRYWITKEGRIQYIDNDQQVRDEIDEQELGGVRSAIPMLAKYLPDLVANLPQEVLGTLGGAMGGPLGAAAGSAAGEGIRKGIGATFYDEPQTWQKNALDVALAAGLGGASETAGRAITAGLNRVGRMGTGKLGRYVNEQIDIEQIADNVAKASAIGIDLTPAEAASSRSLAGLYKDVRGAPGPGAEIIEQFERNLRGPQVESAADRLLQSISKEDSIFEASQKGVSAAQSAKDTLIDARKIATRPYFDAAEQGTDKIDTRNLIRSIRDQSWIAAGENQTNLKWLQKQLYKTEKVKVVKENGVAQMVERRVPKNSIQELQEVKFAIDAKLEGKGSKAISNLSRKRLTEYKNQLLQLMDDASPDYQMAREKWAEMSEPINAFEKTMVETVRELKGENVLRTPEILFSGGTSSPEAIRRAKALIQDADPQAWDGLTRSYLQGELEKSALNAKTGAGIGPEFRRRVFKNARQQKRLEAMLTPEQYQGVKDFFDVVAMTERIVDYNSDTAFKQAAREETSKGISRVANAIEMGHITPKAIAERIRGWMRPAYSEQLATLLTSPDGINQIKRLKRLPETPKKAIEVFTTFSSLMGATIAGSGEREFYPEGSPQQ